MYTTVTVQQSTAREVLTPHVLLGTEDLVNPEPAHLVPDVSQCVLSVPALVGEVVVAGEHFLVDAGRK